jgi:hypothetical protein
LDVGKNGSNRNPYIQADFTKKTICYEDGSEIDNEQKEPERFVGKWNKRRIKCSHIIASGKMSLQDRKMSNVMPRTERLIHYKNHQ